MFQIGAIGSSMNHDDSTPNWFIQAFRGLLSFLDVAVYSLVVIIYEILFNIADSTFFSSATIKAFYSRVQLILGVFMIFKLSISLLQATVNPDYLMDKKNGMGKIISRIIIMLALFTAIMPLSIPLTKTEIEDAKNGNVKSFNYHLNQSGLLFGTLYSLQERILKGNVLVKLVLGDNSDKYEVSEEGNSTLENNANTLAIYVLKGFVRINLKEGAEGKGKITEDDYICSKSAGGRGYSTDETEQLKSYINAKTVSDVINADNITEYCNDGGILHFLDSDDSPKGNRWMFTYTPLISTAVGVLLALVLFGYCLDIAIRTLKLAVLRLIAPIPIISYVNPKSSENGSFAAWTKALISTYVDLFIRLGLVYFAVFLVQDICEHGIDVPYKNGIVGVISTIFIIIGIFHFLRMAPKFITDALGLKGMMTNIGLSGILAGAGALATGGRLGDARDAARASRRAQTDAFNQGKKAPGLMENFTSGRDLMAQYQSGNPKMTYDQMRRGRRHLAREGIDQGYADKLQTKMYKLKDDAERLKNINDKINRSGFASLTNDEKQLLEGEYRKNHNIGQGPLTVQQYQDMQESSMDAYLKKQSDAGKVEAQYNKLTEEQKNWGATPGYYEKYNSDRSDASLGDVMRNGYSAVRGANGRETIRNIRSVPGNTIDRARDNRAAHTARDVRDRGRSTRVTNSQAANNRPDPNHGEHV